MTEYRYLGNFAACEPWAAQGMSCDDCMVSWTGCWDNFQCPECGNGRLPWSPAQIDDDPFAVSQDRQSNIPTVQADATNEIQSSDGGVESGHAGDVTQATGSAVPGAPTSQGDTISPTVLRPAGVAPGPSDSFMAPVQSDDGRKA